MPKDSLRHATELARSGRPDDAVKVAWRVVMPAVVSRDRAGIADTIALAQEIADSTTGSTRADALSLLVYCTECLDAPPEGLFERWSLSSMFTRRSRRTRRCPDCAEDIAAEAKVCRFCGYRFAEPS